MRRRTRSRSRTRTVSRSSHSKRRTCQRTTSKCISASMREAASQRMKAMPSATTIVKRAAAKILKRHYKGEKIPDRLATIAQMVANPTSELVELTAKLTQQLMTRALNFNKRILQSRKSMDIHVLNKQSQRMTQEEYDAHRSQIEVHYDELFQNMVDRIEGRAQQHSPQQAVQQAQAQAQAQAQVQAVQQAQAVQQGFIVPKPGKTSVTLPKKHMSMRDMMQRKVQFSDDGVFKGQMKSMPFTPLTKFLGNTYNEGQFRSSVSHWNLHGMNYFSLGVSFTTKELVDLYMTLFAHFKHPLPGPTTMDTYIYAGITDKWKTIIKYLTAELPNMQSVSIKAPALSTAQWTALQKQFQQFSQQVIHNLKQLRQDQQELTYKGIYINIQHIFEFLQFVKISIGVAIFKSKDSPVIVRPPDDMLTILFDIRDALKLACDNGARKRPDNVSSDAKEQRMCFLQNQMTRKLYDLYLKDRKYGANPLVKWPLPATFVPVCHAYLSNYVSTVNTADTIQIELIDSALIALNDLKTFATSWGPYQVVPTTVPDQQFDVSVDWGSNWGNDGDWFTAKAVAPRQAAVAAPVIPSAVVPAAAAVQAPAASVQAPTAAVQVPPAAVNGNGNGNGNVPAPGPIRSSAIANFTTWTQKIHFLDGIMKRVAKHDKGNAGKNADKIIQFIAQKMWEGGETRMFPIDQVPLKDVKPKKGDVKASVGRLSSLKEDMRAAIGALAANYTTAERKFIATFLQILDYVAANMNLVEVIISQLPDGSTLNATPLLQGANTMSPRTPRTGLQTNSLSNLLSLGS